MGKLTTHILDTAHGCPGLCETTVGQQFGLCSHWVSALGQNIPLISSLRAMRSSRWATKCASTKLLQTSWLMHEHIRLLVLRLQFQLLRRMQALKFQLQIRVLV